MERLKVSPNPALSDVTVQLPSNIAVGTYEIRLVGSDGKEYSRQPYQISPGGTLQIPVANFPPGLFIFYFSAPGKHYTGRFVR